MKKVEKIIEGVAAEYNSKFWGILYSDGKCTSKGFGDLEDAEIHDPDYCKKPTDLTWTPSLGAYNPEYNVLEKAKLVKVKKTITIETL